MTSTSLSSMAISMAMMLADEQESFSEKDGQRMCITKVREFKVQQVTVRESLCLVSLLAFLVLCVCIGASCLCACTPEKGPSLVHLSSEGDFGLVYDGGYSTCRVCWSCWSTWKARCGHLGCMKKRSAGRGRLLKKKEVDFMMASSLETLSF